MSLRYHVLLLFLAVLLLLCASHAQESTLNVDEISRDADGDTDDILELTSPLVDDTLIGIPEDLGELALESNVEPQSGEESESTNDSETLPNTGLDVAEVSPIEQDVNTYNESIEDMPTEVERETPESEEVEAESPAESNLEILPVVDAEPVVDPIPVETQVDEIAPIIPALVEDQDEVEVQAIQLIYPSKDHELLVVNETSLAWLASFNKPVAIVAVCGPLHSGKSFLMNQLLNRTSGFALGPTTEPKTRGLWMWNIPVEWEDHLVLFLDTEGLFASNVSEAYDAKIFAISSLMSSYLIYNSVKIIDQSAIDYIELLARRAQLFGIKAEIAGSDASSVDELSASFVSSPKLLWIVQDFVQEMENNLTPQEWLINLLSSRKKTESTASSLPELFAGIDCFTLFLPEYRREKLRHLDRVDDSDLLPDYRADMKVLREKVYSEASVKLRGNSEKLTGSGAAALLRTLVSAANRGAFPEVPSIWKTFLDLQTQTALKDCIDFYETSMESHCASRGPLNSAELLQTHSNMINDTKDLFSRLTFGFKDLEAKNLEPLLQKLSRMYTTFEASNAANLSRLCQDTYMSIRDDYKVNLRRVDLPMKKTTLHKELDVLAKQHLARYNTDLNRYAKETPYATYLSELESNMKGARNGLELLNADLLLQVIANASSEALAKCTHFLATKDTLNLGVGEATLNQQKKEAMEMATAFFNTKAGFALEDHPTAPAARKALETEIQTALLKHEMVNSERIEKRAQRIVLELASEMTLAAEEIRLPQTKTIIKERMDAISEAFMKKYDESLKDIAMMEPTKTARDRLVAAAATDLAEMFRRNDVKYDRIISDALPSLKGQISPILQEYWWPPAAEEFARTAVTSRLQGVELIENEDLIRELADRFIQLNLQEDILDLWKKLAMTVAVMVLVLVGAIFGLFFRRK